MRGWQKYGIQKLMKTIWICLNEHLDFISVYSQLPAQAGYAGGAEKASMFTVRNLLP